MADGTSIEWTDASWNPLRARRTFIDNGKTKTLVGWHCEHVSEGCRNCYAERMNIGRFGTNLAYKPGYVGQKGLELFLDDTVLEKPLHWRRPRRIFVCSMTDLFGDWVTEEQIDRVFAVMALCPQHTFQVLTKRPERMRAYFDARRSGDPWAEAADYLADLRGMEDHPLVLEPKEIPLPNVWLGVSAEDQATADERIPELLATPAAVRFVSAEPLLGPIDFRNHRVCDECENTPHKLFSNDPLCPIPMPIHDSFQCPLHWWPSDGCDGALKHKIDWVIVGGESGPDARPMHPDWARSIRDQCQAAGVAFFHKQNGAYAVVYDRDREDPDWRQCGDIERRTPAGRWLNLEGGHGFHGERVVRAVPVGKAAAGRLLDGREWSEFPEVRP